MGETPMVLRTGVEIGARMYLEGSPDLSVPTRYLRGADILRICSAALFRSSF